MSAANQRPCFGGTKLCLFDQSNRLVIPAKFRVGFEDVVYLYRDARSNCLVVYTEEDYFKFYARLAENYTGAELHSVQDYVEANIFHSALDKAGRITITDELMNILGLTDKKEARVVRTPERLEIWDEEVWQQKLAKASELDLSRIII